MVWRERNAMRALFARTPIYAEGLTILGCLKELESPTFIFVHGGKRNYENLHSRLPGW